MAFSGQEWQSYICPVRAHTFVLLELILADEVADLLADLPSPVVASHGQEWQFYISTVRAHIDT